MVWEDLYCDKVWQFSIFLSCMVLGESYREPLLSSICQLWGSITPDFLGRFTQAYFYFSPVQIKMNKTAHFSLHHSNLYNTPKPFFCTIKSPSNNHNQGNFKPALSCKLRLVWKCFFFIRDYFTNSAGIKMLSWYHKFTILSSWSGSRKRVPKYALLQEYRPQCNLRSFVLLTASYYSYCDRLCNIPSPCFLLLPGGGGTPIWKWRGCPSSRLGVVNCRFWSRLGLTGQKANIFTCTGIA